MPEQQKMKPLTDKFQKFWTRDRAVLMACIGIALCFWFLNKLSTSFRTVKAVKMDYKIPFGKVFSAPPPQYATVTMQGTGWDLLLGGRDESVFLELTEDSVQTISVKNIIAEKFGNEAVGVNLEQISLQIEDAVTKTVPIEVVSIIEFAKGFDLAEGIQLNPSVVTVSGPKTAIEHLTAIKTDTLRYKNLKEEVIGKVRLMPHPIFKYNISEIETRIQAEQFTEKSMFIPIVVKNAPQRLKIFPNKIKLDCTVALSHYGELNANNFTAEADLNAKILNSKDNTISIFLTKYPNFVRNVKFTPKTAEFYFEK